MGYLFFLLVTGPVAMIGLSRLDIGEKFLRYLQDGKTSSIYSTGLRKNAEAGIVSDQVKLAGCYVEGRGVGINTRQAVKWYRTAAEMGNVSAQRHLGSCYENGVGVAKDEVEAAKWYRKAAEQEDPRGQFRLGNA